jgi:hypothetical protein
MVVGKPLACCPVPLLFCPFLLVELRICLGSSHDTEQPRAELELKLEACATLIWIIDVPICVRHYELFRKIMDSDKKRWLDTHVGFQQLFRIPSGFWRVPGKVAKSNTCTRSCAHVILPI